MKKRFLLFVGLIIGLVYEGFAQPLVSMVNPNIGASHARWFFYTPAAVPFGMAKPAPSTDASYGNRWGWEAVGYDNEHHSIEGFSCFHEFQIGGISLMPVVGQGPTIPSTLEHPDQGYRSRFDKNSEVAQPGYYRVVLTDAPIEAELTATKRVAFQRFNFGDATDARLIFDVGHQQGESGEVMDAFVQQIDEKHVQGYVITAPEYVKAYQPGATVKMYFFAALDKKIVASEVFRDDKVLSSPMAGQGPGIGIRLNFGDLQGEALTVKIGLSYTSCANAANNLKVEADSMNFEQARVQAQADWEQALGKITLTGGKEVDQRKFYTGLFHALLGRGLSSDANGQYPKNDGTVGQIALNAQGTPAYHHYNTDAVWGAFWNLTQLWSLVYPQYFHDFVQTQLDHFKDSGWLSDGLAAGKFVSGVGTNFTGLVVGSALLKGVGTYDDSLAYAAVRKNELEWRERVPGAGKADVKVFVEKGYVPLSYNNKYYSGSGVDGSSFGASHTMEYSFSAHAAKALAEKLGHPQDAKTFERLSHGWEQLYDAETGMIRPIWTSGEKLEPFDPKAAWAGFQEGNALQYTFYVPHEPERLIEKIGQDQFVSRLNKLLAEAEKGAFCGHFEGEKSAFSGVEAGYNHGNQPSLHMAYLFNKAGDFADTQYWVRAICNGFYGYDLIHGYGYGQDEDQGQLGAWYVMASMGLFDLQGGATADPQFQLSTPLFDRVHISLDQDFYLGKSVDIVLKGAKSKGTYLSKAQWNGTPVRDGQLPWFELIQGGILELKTQSKRPAQQPF